jgi:transcriptional regulator with PAS, ATPase and Fis domain
MIQRRLVHGQRGTSVDYQLYDDLVLHWLFLFMSGVWREAGVVRSSTGIAASWTRFQQEFRKFLHCTDIEFPSCDLAEHVFAGIDQVHRAFQNIFQNIIGRSMATARLRAAVWQSIFTHDIRRYRRTLFQQMSRITTLIIGPSGTGKELVARAIGKSQYKPFDSRKSSFVSDDGNDFFALQLAALPTTLVESELFGHVKGSFTGATHDRRGWLETAGPHGAVFLDEVGEIDMAIQVKLLRVLQSRQFQRIGELTPREYSGKLIAATNRDLAKEIERGTFRRDLYFRLCGDVVCTPSLAEQLADQPDDLEQCVRFIVHQLAPDEIDSITDDVLSYINQHLPKSYAWPGNFRELEQCVRNILVHNEYKFPVDRGAAGVNSMTVTATEMDELALTADDVLRRYCTYAYWQTGSYERAANVVKLDRRTVRNKIDREFLDRLGTARQTSE